MRDEAEWQRMIDGLRAGDEEVLEAFCARYATSLARIAEYNIAPALKRRFGGESVAQSACCSFLMRARDGRFEIPDSESLWRLLCAITLRKVREKVRYHSRQKRAIQQEADAGDSGEMPLVERVAGEELEPIEALAMAEEFQGLLDGLDEEERRIVELKLQAQSNAQIAVNLGCSERTVRRLTQALRERLETSFEAA